eukprot:gb/GECH01000611.1/.p1 GENE.gb/GECH01000611.1/~~gb/GECH01000611.1/.p1  ORF type:complete len:120 (+),score=33.85 gb/GECH01000611.1/:1-360(+)
MGRERPIPPEELLLRKMNTLLEHSIKNIQKENPEINLDLEEFAESLDVKDKKIQHIFESLIKETYFIQSNDDNMPDSPISFSQTPSLRRSRNLHSVQAVLRMFSETMEPEEHNSETGFL